MDSLIVRDLGRAGYAEAYAEQVRTLEGVLVAREAGARVGELLFVEHEPVITVTKRAGASGQVLASAEELAGQAEGGFDAVVVGSGSGLTHAGLLAGLRLAGSEARVFGGCVRRPAEAQKARIGAVLQALAELLGRDLPIREVDVQLRDGALAPGYGRLGPRAEAAMRMGARREGLLLDPVYTAKAFAAIPELLEEGALTRGERVLFVHTGGLAALFAYEAELRGI